MSDQERHIWIVDDVPSNRRLLEKILARAGYTSRLFSSAEALLEALRTERPALILMDVMMPGITGLDALLSMRQQGLRGDVPVILVTSMDDPSIRERAFHWGANDFVSKPINQNELLVRVQRLYQEKSYGDRPTALSTSEQRHQVLWIGDCRPHILLGLDQLATLAVERAPADDYMSCLDEAHVVVVDVEPQLIESTVESISEAVDIPIVALMDDIQTRAIPSLDSGASLALTAGTPAAVAIRQVRSLAVGYRRLADVRRELERVRQRVLVDKETGLIAAESFHDALRFEQDRARRFKHRTSLVLIQIIDTELRRRAGQGARVSALRAVGRFVTEAIRAVDVAGRVGRAEIGILLPETSSSGAIEVIRRLNQAADGASIHVGGGDELPISLRIGTTSSLAGSSDASTMLNAARKALMTSGQVPSV